MKTMYLTVRVDFSCPEGMDLETAQGLAEMGKLREFCNGRPESVRAALQTEIGSLHTLYNYLIA